MSNRASKAFKLRTADPKPGRQLAPDVAKALRDASRAKDDAQRRAELAVARAKVEVGEAHERVVAALVAAGADPYKTWSLTDDDRLVEVALS